MYFSTDTIDGHVRHCAAVKYLAALNNNISNNNMKPTLTQFFVDFLLAWRKTSPTQINLHKEPKSYATYKDFEMDTKILVTV